MPFGGIVLLLAAFLFERGNGFFFLAAFRRRQDGDGDQPVEAPFAAPSSLLYGTLLALKTMSVEPH
jgi:hypothetical protein